MENNKFYLCLTRAPRVTKVRYAMLLCPFFVFHSLGNCSFDMDMCSALADTHIYTLFLEHQRSFVSCHYTLVISHIFVNVLTADIGTRL